ncbi:hypothetical protein Glove_139g189 [Diversispora epigaea]|uniref:Protein kinase domain-containing protein n=1 Tax=Diversispora epigaea TaxID=1348612 RepID=A0A397IVK6_9GLOM|nr:hypothetical protein Glove_139g189 [Diversispora epigaea]
MSEICPECNQDYANDRWCRPCNSTRFKNDFDKWTSGNIIMDKFIQDAQLNASYCDKIIEWIPYDRFQDIKEMVKGGFGTIYRAKWIDGRRGVWNIENQQWKRYGQREVVLKKFDGIGDINEDFLNEFAIHLKTMDTYLSVSFYGITKDPETHKYMMVCWFKKLKYLRNLTIIFTEIHDLNIVHQDFHPGNVLSYNFNYEYLYVTDFGLSKLIEKNVENPQKGNVFGVLPYIAPEVLGGKEYTKAADVYSFAIIAYEMITGFRPYPDVPHDEELALKICNGLRPKIPFHTPKLITQVIMRCWDARIAHRPTFEGLCHELSKYCSDCFMRTGVIGIQIKEAEEFSENQTTTTTTTSINYKTHPQAIYTSRLLNFSNLPKPVNEENFVKELKELTESFSRIFTNDDIEDF